MRKIRRRRSNRTTRGPVAIGLQEDQQQEDKDTKGQTQADTYIHTYIHAYIHTYIHKGMQTDMKQMRTNAFEQRRKKTLLNENAKEKRARTKLYE